MTFITSRKHGAMRNGPSPTFGKLTATTLFTSILLASPVMAESAASVDASTMPQLSDAKTLTGVHVNATATPDYRVDNMSSPKFTQPILDTPQTIQIISKDLIQQQGATTLTQALQNSPGVGTFYAGENGSTSTGDEIYMRGFDTANSIFVDGVRDLGSISRDVFNIEQIEVTKGPDSTDYGRTAPTGAINMVSKQPLLRNSVSGSVAYGSNNQKRATADLNRAIGSNAGFRLNVLGQKSGVPRRDEVKNNRWGLSPSLAFGLGTSTRVYLDYLHIKQNNVPDGGIPTIGLPGYSSPDPTRPFLTTAPRVDSNGFYGTNQDHDRVDDDMFTAIIQHDFSPDVVLHDTLHWGRTHQDYLLTSFTATAAHLLTPDPGEPSTWTLARSNPNFKDQTNRILTNQANLTAHVETGAVSQSISAGIELSQEKLSTGGPGVLDNSAWPDANLYAPDPHVGGLIYGDTGAYSQGKTNTAAAYLFDTLKFGSHWLVNAGARLDHYTTDFNSMVACGAKNAPACAPLPAGTPVPGANARKSGNLPNWQVGVVYKPVTNGSIYANFATSEQPPGGDSLSFSASANSANNPLFNPSRARTAEIGSKWSLIDDQLLLTGALYSTTVTDLVAQDPVSLLYYQIGRERVQGAELTAVGKLSANWSVSAGFTTMNTSAGTGAVGGGSSASSPANDGSNALAYTPKKSFTSWTTYHLPFGLTIGGGARYNGALKRGTDGAIGTPDSTDAYWVFNALASYPVNKHFDLQLNVYNLFNKSYVASINKSGYRYIPGTPRSAMLTANFRF